jgi:hypothetical protein
MDLEILDLPIPVLDREEDGRVRGSVVVCLELLTHGGASLVERVGVSDFHQHPLGSTSD